MLSLFFQLIRFLGIGFLNTAIDFSVINFLAGLFGIYKGTTLGLLNVVSFSIAVGHSYFWNKNFAFALRENERFFQNIWKFAASATLGAGVLIGVIWGAKQQYAFSYYLLMLAVLAVGEVVLWNVFRLATPKVSAISRRQLILFISITIVGVFINSGIVSVVTGQVHPLFGLNKELWLNMVKAGATAVSLIWNFAGYRILVFKK